MSKRLITAQKAFALDFRPKRHQLIYHTEIDENDFTYKDDPKDKQESKMDKKIKKIMKGTKKLEKEEKSLLKMDKKHDKKMEKCDMIMKKGKK